jgi:hypothetical protein
VEHRLGSRLAVNRLARLELRADNYSPGLLSNLSMSGGYVETVAQIPPGSRIYVHLEWAEPQGPVESWRIPAHVVRADARGVGLEWSRFAPRAVRRLLGAAGTAGARAAAPKAVAAIVTPDDAPMSEPGLSAPREPPHCAR